MINLTNGNDQTIFHHPPCQLFIHLYIYIYFFFWGGGGSLDQARCFFWKLYIGLAIYTIGLGLLKRSMKHRPSAMPRPIDINLNIANPLFQGPRK